MKTAYFAGGCFWGVEYFFKRARGVVSTRVGYMGGHKENPTYEEVCSGATGHLETVEVAYDPRETSFEELAKLFFEIHDPTQINRQGPDVGEQYQSAVLYLDEDQKKIAEKLISKLEGKGYRVATRLRRAGVFGRLRSITKIITRRQVENRIAISTLKGFNRSRRGLAGYNSREQQLVLINRFSFK